MSCISLNTHSLLWLLEKSTISSSFFFFKSLSMSMKNCNNNCVTVTNNFLGISQNVCGFIKLMNTLFVKVLQ